MRGPRPPGKPGSASLHALVGLMARQMYTDRLASTVSELETEEMATRTISRQRRREANPDEQVFEWAFRSSKNMARGKPIMYSTLLHGDGNLSCNCPGWIFKKKSADRGCKHTKQVEVESRRLYADWLAGKELPVMGAADTTQGLAATATPSTETSPSVEVEAEQIRYGRFIDLD